MKLLINKSKESVLAKEVLKPKSFFKRVKGLLGCSCFDSYKTLWITDCSSIHTFFMKFSIDVVFVDKFLKVKKVYQSVPPGKILFGGFQARSVFEFSEGGAKNVNIGDQLHVDS